MQCKWNRDPNNRLRVWIFNDNGERNYPNMIKAINEAKSWCKVSGINFFDDSFFSIRFTDEDDLNFFMLRWS